MYGRRTFLGAGATSAAFGNLLEERAAAAGEALNIPAEFAPRGKDGRLKRLGTLDLESQQDFTLGFRLMHTRRIQASAFNVFNKLMASKGIDPATPMRREEMLALVADEPGINITAKTWLANQQVTWKTLQDHFHAHADEYLAEMESADKAGPGTLELNPKMAIPDCARHEIHIQPGE